MDAGYYVIPGIDKTKLNRKSILVTDTDTDKEIIDNVIFESQKQRIDKITRIVAGAMWVSYTDLKSKTRKREIIEPRQVAQFFCSEDGINYKAIALYFNQNERSTVYNSVTAINNIKDTDRKKSFLINEIEQLLTKIL